MVIETSHILTRDVENPTIPYRDKRKNAEWYDKPLVKGTRVVVKKFLADTYSNLKGFNYEIGLDVSGDLEPSHGGSWMPLAYENEDGVISFHSEKFLNRAETTKEKVECNARITFQTLIWASLSQPIEDYKSLFNDCADYGYRSASDALYQLYEQGKITFADIRKALIDSEKSEKVSQ